MEIEAPAFAEIQQMQAASVSDLRKALEPGETVIEYFMTGDYVSAFIASRDSFNIARKIASKSEIEQVLATFARFSREHVDQPKLDATRSRMRYGFALRMNSSPAIAAALAPYILLRRTPDTINKVFDLYQQVTPQDIRAMAAKYFTESNRTIVTLATQAGTK